MVLRHSPGRASHYLHTMENADDLEHRVLFVCIAPSSACLVSGQENNVRNKKKEMNQLHISLFCPCELTGNPLR